MVTIEIYKYEPAILPFRIYGAVIGLVGGANYGLNILADRVPEYILKKSSQLNGNEFCFDRSWVTLMKKVHLFVSGYE